MKNQILILFVLGAFLSLSWAAQERPVFDPKTKASMKAILNKINETEEIHKINNNELYHASQAGVVGTDEVGPEALKPGQAGQLSGNKTDDDLSKINE